MAGGPRHDLVERAAEERAPDQQEREQQRVQQRHEPRQQQRRAPPVRLDVSIEAVGPKHRLLPPSSRSVPSRSNAIDRARRPSWPRHVGPERSYRACDIRRKYARVSDAFAEPASHLPRPARWAW